MKEKSPTPSNGKVVLTVRIPSKLHAALLKLKEDRGVSVQHFVTRAVEQALDETKKRNA